jgi:hypothetical protein
MVAGSAASAGVATSAAKPINIPIFRMRLLPRTGVASRFEASDDKSNDADQRFN